MSIFFFGFVAWPWNLSLYAGQCGYDVEKVYWSLKLHFTRILDVCILFSILNIALIIFNQSGILVDTMETSIETENKKENKNENTLLYILVFLSYLTVCKCVFMTLLIFYFVFPYIGKLHMVIQVVPSFLISWIDFYAIW
jgi:hypothetical protein